MIGNPVTQSALDFFARPIVFINYEGSFDQNVFPHIRWTLSAESKNCMDLNRVCLVVAICVYQLMPVISQNLQTWTSRRPTSPWNHFLHIKLFFSMVTWFPLATTANNTSTKSIYQQVFPAKLHGLPVKVIATEQMRNQVRKLKTKHWQNLERVSKLMFSSMTHQK